MLAGRVLRIVVGDVRTEKRDVKDWVDFQMIWEFQLVVV